MINIEIICVGKLKEKFWSEAVDEYLKRLSSYCKLKVTELKEAKLGGSGEAAEEAVRQAESKDILSHIKEGQYVIALEVGGKRLSSPELAEKINALALEGKSDLVFAIGGSLGFTKDVGSRADFSLSFSDMTFPHQLMRVILVEQIYRAFKINSGETYHK